VKWGSEAMLHGKSLEPHMSALGQKQTSNSGPLMSALPPKADIRQRDRDALGFVSA
jgi:hypothetical protein